ncbi:MAG: pitrilysin family protein [Eubacteriales bacterium]|nr:pitrilysin family protein [Eubacteriales bacterium]MDD4768584.1 pitrilysin family protein [Eubacteriales bacterium]
MEYSQQRLANGTSLHLLPMDNYKTTFVGVFLYWPLGEDAARSAIIPHVLQRGTATYPTARELRARLAELYGTQFGIGLLKRGENLILHLKIQLVNDQYLPGNTSLLEEALDIFRDVLLYPYTEQGRFAESYIQGEKRNIQARIKSLLNDKSRFAFHRCLQHLCPGRGYSQNQYGSLRQVEAVTAENAWQQYQHLLKNAAADIYVCGRYDHNRIVEGIGSRLQWPRQPGREPEMPRLLEQQEHSLIQERMDINQGKLVMALCSDITQQSDLYPALIMYNGILGGYPHAKLFQNVREKRGLAYYIGSSLDSIMGLQFITAGIDAGSFQETTEVVARQLEDMGQGRISKQELEWTRSSLQTGLLQMYDDLGEQVALAVDARISGRRWTIPSLLEALDQISVGDVKEAARRMHLQTTYFLSGGGD